METSNNIICRSVIGQYCNGEQGGHGGGNWSGELSRRMLVQFMSFSVGDFFPYFKWIDFLRGFIASLKSTSKALDTFSDQVVEEDEAITSLNSTHDAEDFVDILLRLQKDHMLDFELTQSDIKPSDKTRSWLELRLIRQHWNG